MVKIALKLGDSYGKEKRGYLASSRIRGHWLAKYWSECDDFFYPEEFGQESERFFAVENQLRVFKNYDVIIMNKTYEWRLVRELVKKGKKVILDFCDPDFLLSHSSKQRCNDSRECIKYATCIVANGAELKSELQNITDKKVYIIPDRMDPEFHYPKKRTHRKELKYLVWYGYSENLRVLEPYLTDVINQGYEITIISDKFFDNFLIATNRNAKLQMTFKIWHPQSVNRQIVEADCVFVGEDPDPYLKKWKSNNRELTAYYLKMPVAYNIKDLDRLQGKESRIENALNGYSYANKYFNIKQSVEEYKQIIKEIL